MMSPTWNRLLEAQSLKVVEAFAGGTSQWSLYSREETESEIIKKVTSQKNMFLEWVNDDGSTGFGV